eukprot:comp11683_c0_seq1/m.6221 comp11683_c0_seq1/g.6221  ORF comp11683_c0_seq1/g.6221 comp11683_c0_seq1/m.6221 type:complete len:426 (-) comp11683_c0_seq1:175-1452(-)
MSQDGAKPAKYNVIPGKSIGPFVVGMPLSVAIDYLKQQFREIKSVDLLYSERQPLQVDIVVRLNRDGLQLRFNPSTQRLKIVEVFDPSCVVLSYGGTVFSSAETLPTFANIYRLFGPSYPGDYDAVQHYYRLSYPGLAFFFPIPSKYDSLYANGKGDVPLQFLDGTTPVARRLCIYSEEALNPPQIANTAQSPTWPVEEVLVKPGVGIQLVQSGAQVLFGDSCQDVLSEIGPPSKVFYKEEDKMKIHARSAKSSTKCSDYFYNYFDLGLDILFSATTHTVTKFVLHTNFPCHYDFNVYQKCNFRILIRRPDKSPTQKDPSPPAVDDEGTGEHVPEYKETTGTEGEKSARASWSDDEAGGVFVVTGDTTWTSIQSTLGPAHGKPVVYDRGSANNPFGPTHFFGYSDTIYEVMRNDHVASVTLFAAD